MQVSEIAEMDVVKSRKGCGVAVVTDGDLKCPLCATTAACSLQQFTSSPANARRSFPSPRKRQTPGSNGGAHSEYGLAVEARGISLGRATVRVHGTLEVSFGREVSARSRQERSQVEGAAGKVDGDGSNRPQLPADRAVSR